MRLLVVADIHYSLPQYDWVVAVAGDFDLVVLAGDHLDLSSMVDGRAQRVVVRKYFDRLAELVPLVVCSGNHDLDAVAGDEKVARWLGGSLGERIYRDGDTFVLDGTLFTVCPWWDGPAARAAIASQIERDAACRDGRWIWIHHAPPDASPISWGGQRSYGDAALGAWIAQYAPDIVLSGHVHQSPFVRDGSWVDRIGGSWVFNAGHQYGAPPAYIVLDTDAGEALWFSAAGSQFVRLGEALTRPVERLAAAPAWLTAADRRRVRVPARTLPPAGG
jgi:Icc-related predicted phosphoesterase